MTTDSTSPAAWPALKRGYALGTSLVGAMSMVVCGAVAAVLGGDGQTIILASAALAIGIAISLAPVIIGVKFETFAMAVVAASGARMLVAMAIVVIGSVALDMARKPLGLGVGSGLLLSLIAETVLVMAILARVNRRTELA